MNSRLCDAALSRLAPSAILPAYDRSATRIGVVHFGPGAFHRAHQAFFIDRMLAHDPGLAICAVSLHNEAVRAALGPQDGLYSLIVREFEPSIRIIGSIKTVLTAPSATEAIFARLADPTVRFVSATVTEKGYCLTPSGDLDLSHPGIGQDLADPDNPQTLIGWLVAGLRRRRAAGGPGLTALSCDNLSGNGARWRGASLQFAEACGDFDLARWIEDRVVFPDGMVDAITPATDEGLRSEAEQRLGLLDAWPIQREGFAQWVIGGDLGGDAATFAQAGVTFTRDIDAFERAKLRLLNGAHSTLAYVGLRLGFATVSQAMADAKLGAFIETLMRRDIAASLRPTTGQDLNSYISEILARLRNPAIVHQLSQIAWDGSQKLPVRLLETITEALEAGRPAARLVTGIAAWRLFIRTRSQSGFTITDPLAERLNEIGRACDGEAIADVDRFLALRAVFPARLVTDAQFRMALATAYGQLAGPDPASAFAL